jgi:hypothetical protein
MKLSALPVTVFFSEHTTHTMVFTKVLSLETLASFSRERGVQLVLLVQQILLAVLIFIVLLLEAIELNKPELLQLNALLLRLAHPLCLIGRVPLDCRGRM